MLCSWNSWQVVTGWVSFFWKIQKWPHFRLSCLSWQRFAPFFFLLMLVVIFFFQMVHLMSWLLIWPQCSCDLFNKHILLQYRIKQSKEGIRKLLYCLCCIFECFIHQFMWQYMAYLVYIVFFVVMLFILWQWFYEHISVFSFFFLFSPCGTLLLFKRIRLARTLTKG